MEGRNKPCAKPPRLSAFKIYTFPLYFNQYVGIGNLRTDLKREVFTLIANEMTEEDKPFAASYNDSLDPSAVENRRVKQTRPRRPEIQVRCVEIDILVRLKVIRL